MSKPDTRTDYPPSKPKIEPRPGSTEPKRPPKPKQSQEAFYGTHVIYPLDYTDAAWAMVLENRRKTNDR